MLLVDDEAESAGWASVFKALFGGLTYSKDAAGAAELAGAAIDLCLVDLDLGSPGEGLNVLLDLRNRYFDLPLVAFSAHDRADYCQAALEAGADVYFTKEIDDAADRDSADYYRRFARILGSLPRRDDPLRRAWRSFAAVEARLDAFEDSRSDDGYGTLRAGDFVRLAYFFATARPADAEGDPLQEVRDRIFLGDPLLAAQSVLHLALLILCTRLTGTPPADNTPLYRLLESLPYPNNRNHVRRLKALSKGELRHRQRGILEKRSGDLLEAMVGFIAKQAGYFPEPPEVPRLAPVRPPHIAPRTEVKGEYRTKGLVALAAGAGTFRPVNVVEANVILLDPSPEEWRSILSAFDSIAANRLDDTLAQIASILDRRDRDRPVLVVSLEWGADPPAALGLVEQARERWPWLPAVVVAGIDSAVLAQRALARGAADYFLLHPVERGRERAYAGRLYDLLKRVGKLHLREHAIREALDALSDLQPLIPPRFGEEYAQRVRDALLLTMYCYYPDRNPAARWRLLRLLKVSGRLESEPLTRTSFFLAALTLENLTKRTQCKKSREYRHLFDIRTAALHNSVGGSIARAERLLDCTPAGYLRAVLAEMRGICEADAQRVARA